MRRLRVISMILGCALLATGVARAAEPRPQTAASSPTVPGSASDQAIHRTHHVPADKKKPQPYTKAAEKPKGELATAEPGQPHAGAVARPSTLPPQSANDRPSAPQPNFPNAGQPAKNRAVPVTKGTPRSQDQATAIALPVRPPTMISPAAAPHNEVRHRGPNPAVLGGAATSKPTATAAISGSSVHRKP